MSSPLVLHLDFLSPYAYLASIEIDRIARARQRQVEHVPVVLAAMLDTFGTIGPAEVPVKREYVYLDVHRKAALLGVPLRLPPRHPFAPLAALRAATSFADRSERARAVEALFHAAWGTGAGIDTDALVIEALNRCGLDGEAAVARRATADVKAALHRATSDAIARGVFGVPTVTVDDAVFWGLDSLPSLEAFLDGRDPITPAIRENVRVLPIGIERKRR